MRRLNLLALKTILPWTGRVLAYIFKPDFKRSAKPIQRSYYGFGGLLAQFFHSIGTLERSHPWLRSGIMVRPLDVLTHAWARINWRKPWAESTVLTVSVTLLLTTAVLGATALGAGSLLTIGQAQAQSLFVPASPGTDLALRYMSEAFGVAIPGVPMQAVDGIVTGFHKMMALYSTAMLILAGFVLLYIILTVITATAHEGRFGGSGFNQVWAPIRLVIAIGLLVPLPMPGNYNGYNSGQHIVLKLSEWGSGLATQLWIPFATALANRGDVIATPSVSAAALAVRGVLLNEFCMVRYNKILIDNPPPAPLPQVVVAIQTKQNSKLITYTQENDTNGTYCGTTTYDFVNDNMSMAGAISTFFENAYNNMRNKANQLAQVLNSDNYISTSSALPATGVEEALKKEVAKQYFLIVDSYQKEMRNALQSIIATQGQAATDAMTQAVTESGWAGAAVWFNTIARLNGEVMSAARAIPSSSKPSLKTGSSTSNTDACTQYGEANPDCKVSQGVNILDEYLKAAPAMYSIIGLPTNFGESTSMAGVYTPPVAAGLTMGLQPGKSNSESTMEAGPIIMSLLKNSYLGGPFGGIGLGAEANLSKVNPLAQLASIGSWLIDKSVVLLGLAAILPLGLSFMLVTLGLMGVGGGIALFYVLPLFPFIRLTFAVVGWLLNILEALIAIPLIAMAHLKTDGSGISGDMARRSYFMILSIFLRPSLLIIGMIIGLMLFSVAIGVLNASYKSAVVGFMGMSAANEDMSGLSTIMYTLLYCVLAWGLCNLCFKMIEEIPNQAMEWIGGAAARAITEDEQAAKVLSGAGDQFMLIGRTYSERSRLRLGGMPKG